MTGGRSITSIVAEVLLIFTLTIVALGFVLPAFSEYDASDVQAVCSKHDGVRQVAPTQWETAVQEAEALVVCKDGHVGDIR